MPQHVEPIRQAAAAGVTALLLFAGAQSWSAGIAGSKHDFSGSGWGSGEICIFCHTPHNATKSAANSPLWNHQVSSATYTLYSSATLRQTPVPPRGPSKLCLSCHDGTIAIESFGGSVGAHFVSGRANLGTDLANDHPVSIYWNHQTMAGGAPSCANCHNFHGPLAYNLPFFDRYLECATCHEPHNNGPETKMLRKALSRSAICLHCHGK